MIQTTFEFFYYVFQLKKIDSFKKNNNNNQSQIEENNE
jgi:hypothetical protein